MPSSKTPPFHPHTPAKCQKIEAGGACTSTLLKILYADEENPETLLSFTEVLEAMREDLKGNRFSQIPQLSSMNPIDVSDTFDLVPPEATGTKRAVMIGINYVGDSPGELSGCWNDVLNMKRYIMQVHGFDEENSECREAVIRQAIRV